MAGRPAAGQGQDRPGETGCIYALVDPRDHNIFYVGQTRDLDARKRTHFAGGHSLSGAKIKILRSNGLLPLVVVLQGDLPLRRLSLAEAFWIDLLRQRGGELLNVTGLAAEERRQRPHPPRAEGFGAPRIALPCYDEGKDQPLQQLRELRRQQRVRDLNLPLNAGKPWTAGEDAALRALFRHGLRASDIARRFGRSRDAVAARLVRLGVAAEEPRGLQTRATEKAGAE
ncbi:MAG: hypothetical protein KG075_07850 [Alphaproteobacteria bacterium]|nr:hypothetical protein [Alphaproteobacteria bacterium]